MGANYFVKLEDAATNTPVMSFFIYGGSTMDAEVPLGNFVLKYAAGRSWCGDADLFGADTATNKAEHIFTFERRPVTGGYELTHETVELILQPGGNLQTHTIRREDF